MKAKTTAIFIALARQCMDLKTLSAKTGICYPAIRRAASGANVQITTIGRIAQALNIDPSEIISEQEADNNAYADN